MPLRSDFLFILGSGLLCLFLLQCESAGFNPSLADDDDDNNNDSSEEDESNDLSVDTEEFISDDDDDNDDGDTDPDHDFDSDGFTDNEGDCNDAEPLINPDAIEDLGDGGVGDNVDNDCDGLTDEIEECDTQPVGSEAADLAAAINLCDDRFLVAVDKKASSPQGDKGFDTLASQGTNDCLVARQGAEMLAISTGPVGQPNPNNAQSLGAFAAEETLDPQPEFQGENQTTAEKRAACDRSQLVLSLASPSNATGFSFDFLFGSSEYDEWINQGFNDTFYAIMEYDALNGGKTTNIAFDHNENEIEVDTNYFENTIAPCDEAGSGWEVDVIGKSGSTGWLRTTWSIEKPRDPFTLTFSIHDEGDCIYDSITFIDNFQWLTGKVEEETIIIVD